LKKNYPLIVIGGPTATGKTKLAIELAQKINGVIINADSVQIYRDLVIGSNKGNINKVDCIKISNIPLNRFELENSKVYGYMFDIVNPDEDFNLYNYQQLSRELINYIRHNGQIPILVGGSGLYIDSVIRDYTIQINNNDKSTRVRLSEMNTNELQKLIPINILDSLNNSDKNNPRRLIRLIEKLNNNETSEEYSKFKFHEHVFFYPMFDKDQLIKKINFRVEEMFEQGFVDEVVKLIEKFPSIPRSLQSTGYKEIVNMLLSSTKIELQDCIEMVKIAHRKYAKRQITWFEGERRNYNLIKVSDVDDILNYLNLNY
jgi:tRNA dimethylallyltransferase